jgi:hypothetical protein
VSCLNRVPEKSSPSSFTRSSSRTSFFKVRTHDLQNVADDSIGCNGSSRLADSQDRVRARS